MSRESEFSGKSPTGKEDYFVDRKLVFRLKQFVGEQRANGSLVTEDTAFDFLLDKFKEYARKPQGALRKSVGRVVRKCLDGSPTPPRDRNKRARGNDYGGQQQQHLSGTEVPRLAKKGGKGRKRDYTDDSDPEVSDDELAAREIEAGMQSRTHNLLNQSVAAGYRNGDKTATGSDEERDDRIQGARSARKRPKRPRPLGSPRTPGKSSTMALDWNQETATSGGAAAAETSRTGDFVAERPSARYCDLGGISGILQEVRELIEYPLVHPEVYAHLGIEPPRGILLHGPPGCGKTLLANAIAGELNVPFLRISAPEIVSGMSGESEQKVRDLFRAAVQNAPCIVFVDEVDAITPKRETSSRGMEKRIVAQLLTCMDSLTMENTGGKPVIVIGATNRPNDLDSALRRAGRFDREICLGVPDLEARARILQVMSSKMTLSGDIDFSQIAKKTPGFVGADLSSLTKEAAVVAINRIFAHLRAPSTTPPREDVAGLSTTPSRIAAGAPNGNGGGHVEGKVLRPLAPSCGAEGKASEASEGQETRETTATHEKRQGLPGSENHDEHSQPEPEPGRGGGKYRKENGSNDGIAGDADGDVVGHLSAPLSAQQLARLSVTMEDFLKAVKKVQPSAKREGFATVPGVSWKDVGALASVREELGLSILDPIAFPERFESLGLTVPAGVLLYGPPGCGKTLLAKAIANESGANFISVKGPELLDKYVGESEKSVRRVFQRARASSPCIIFFDELDALCPRRGSGGGEAGGVSERVVNQLLTEMDGLEARRNVFVVAATNRPELIDPAMLRPGRLDRLLYVPLPSPADRVSILKAISSSVALGPDVDLETVGRSPKAEGFSGADLAALLREAGLDVLRHLKNCGTASSGSDLGVEEGATVITAKNFENAFLRTKPSVAVADRKFYTSMKGRLRRARAHSSETQDRSNDADGTDNIDGTECAVPCADKRKREDNVDVGKGNKLAS